MFDQRKLFEAYSSVGESPSKKTHAIEGQQGNVFVCPRSHRCHSMQRLTCDPITAQAALHRPRLGTQLWMDAGIPFLISITHPQGLLHSAGSLLPISSIVAFQNHQAPST
jgi:hypothetical protein